MGRSERTKKSNGAKILVLILILLIIGAGAFVAIKLLNDRGENPEQKNEQQNVEKVKPVVKKEPKTFKGTDRPIAVMLDNHIDAMPQAGLNSAYVVYEFVVEGGETRLMALFKGVDVDKIGPIRSSRHYYLDYALEHDAIYVHFGWSPYAQSDISTLGVNNINGITESSTSFRRSTDSDHSYLHSVTTSTDTIKEIAERKGYETTSDQKSVLKYVGDEFDLPGNMQALTVHIPNSDHNWVDYEYDPVTKRYTRYSRDVQQLDWATDEVVTVKNIIVVKCENWTIRGDEKGRQDIDNIGGLDGYYITNGKAIPIRAEKESREAQTVYKDLQGNEIEVNDGNTFIQFCPIDADVTIEPGIPQPVVTENANTENTNTVKQ